MISGSLQIIEKWGMISMNSPQIFVDVKHVVVVNAGESFDTKFCFKRPHDVAEKTNRISERFSRRICTEIYEHLKKNNAANVLRRSSSSATKYFVKQTQNITILLIILFLWLRKRFISGVSKHPVLIWRKYSSCASVKINKLILKWFQPFLRVSIVSSPLSFNLLTSFCNFFHWACMINVQRKL